MSDKYNLLTESTAAEVAKRARSTAEMARLYVSKEGHPEVRRNATSGEVGQGGEDRRSLVCAEVWHRFGPRTAEHPAALNCEPYLLDALYRWMLGTCHTPAAWSTYAARMWRWVAVTRRRSLSAQADTTPRQLADFLFELERDLAPRSVVGHRDVLRSWFAWLLDRELIGRSPVSRDVVRSFRVDHQALVRGDGTRQALTADEAAAVARWCLIEAAPWVGLAVLLELGAGLRSAEIVALKRNHLVSAALPTEQEPNRVVWRLTVLGKGKHQRTVDLEPVVIAAIQRYRTKCRRVGTRGHLLAAPGGGGYTPRQVQRWVKDAAKVIGRADIIASHDLRRTFATLLRERGADPRHIQRTLGHASIVTTDRCYVVRQAPAVVTTGIPVPQESTT